MSELKIKTEFPYVIKHNISWDHPDWKKMHIWCNQNIGEYKKEYAWFLSSEWCFRTQEQALVFAVTWGGG